MKLIQLSKYPPIEGQVSTVSYWLARGLARRGHEVAVVTNADEVEAPCRLWMEDGGGEAWLAPAFEESGGRVILLNTAPFDRSQFHIPPSNPFITKLTALALRAIRDLGHDLVFSHYLEPYAMAGHLASSLAGVPHVVTHSGSDIGRLLKNPALAPAYLEIIRRATLFVAKNRHAAEATGVAIARGVLPYAPPDEYFNLDAPALDLNGLMSRAGQYIRDELKWHTREFDPARTTFGVYGKLFEVKGIYDLLSALARLRRAGFDFNLLLMTRWRRGEDTLRECVVAAGLEDRTWLLPFLPNWQVPAFIKLCTAVCYLERRWPMPVHTSIVPREVMACGKCLVISEEVRGGGLYAKHLTHGETCLAVEEPTDIDLLASRLRRVLEEPDDAEAIGRRAHAASFGMSSHTQFITGWEKLFSACLETR
jgi:glycosyltransferase involved in cell wall biosynthesis